MQTFFLGNEKAAEILINNGATIDFINKNGRTPLHVAADKGNFQIQRNVIKNLTYSSLSGKTKTVDLLIKSGANASIADQAGKTPLHLATSQGKLSRKMAGFPKFFIPIHEIGIH